VEEGLLGNVLKVVGSSLVSSEPGSKGDEELSERRMNVHEECSADVLKGKRRDGQRGTVETNEN
jgi:hypothetical protein